MDLDRLAERRNAAMLTVLVGVLLFLPLLGSFGLWEPYEIKVADAAKEIMATGGWAMPMRSVRPPLSLWLITGGFRAFGVGEWGGRLPVALTAVAALLACLYAGTALVRGRGALLGVAALCGMPGFFLGARSLVTDAPMIAAQALAIGGLCRALWPARESSLAARVGHALLGGLGLLLGHLAGGALLGVALPLAALSLALCLVGGGDLMQTVLRWVMGALTVALLAVIATRKQGVYTPLLGGVPRAAQHAIEFTTVIKRLGFYAFPWVALLPLALARPLATLARRSINRPEVAPGDAAAGSADGHAPTDASRSDEDDLTRARFGRLVLVTWLGAGYVLTTLQCAWAGEVVFPALAAVALLAGDFLDGAMDDEHPLGFVGFLAFIAVIVLVHDLFLAPELYLGAHVLEGIKWPGPLTVEPYVILGFGIAFALLVGLGLGVRAGRRGMLWLAVACALVLSFTSTYWMVPSLSAHLSFKGLFTKYKALGGADGELGQYRAPSSTSWGGLKPRDLPSLDQVFAFLAKPTRAFVIVAAEEMAPLDQYARTHEGSGAPTTYFVVDDSNSRFVLLSNQLEPGKTDLNPLRRLVVDKLPRPPQHELKDISFENKVELVGYDLPSEIDRSRTFTITLYYHVLAPLGAAYKVFVHFDGAGNRFNGDHVPLDGKFPTNYWVPGFYIIDEHKIDIDKTMNPAGWYTIYTGFWAGDTRLKASAGGQSDGDNRVKIGTVRVK